MKKNMAVSLMGLALMPMGFLVAMLGLSVPGVAVFLIGYAASIVEMLIAKDKEEAPSQVEQRPSPSDLKNRPNRKPSE